MHCPALQLESNSYVLQIRRHTLHETRLVAAPGPRVNALPRQQQRLQLEARMQRRAATERDWQLSKLEVVKIRLQTHHFHIYISIRKIENINSARAAWHA